MSEHIQFETNGVTVLVVPIHVEYIDCTFEMLPYNELIIRYPSGSYDSYCAIPEGDWSIHAIIPEITDDLLGQLLPETFKGRRYSHFCDILKAHGIDPKQKNVLLIKRK